MTAQEGTTNPDMLSNYIRRAYRLRYLWLHVLLLGVSFALGFYSTDTWWARVGLALAQYAFLIAFGLYAWIGWIMLRRTDQTPLLPSVTFITVCFSFALTVTILATPNPLRPYWWLGLVWAGLGFPMLFVFFKLLRLVRSTRIRLQTASSGLRNGK